MLFNSLPYIFVFLPIVVVIYWLLLKNHLVFISKIWLVIASIAFYSWWDPKYTTLLLFSMLINFAIGSSFRAKIFNEASNRKKLLIFGLLVNIAILGYFKYMNFFIDNINYIFHSHIAIAKIILPLGISFFTFTQIAYIVDAYKKEADEYNFINYLLFVTFFPHLIAGPILHHKEMMPQFSELKRKVIRWDNLTKGLFLFIIGLFKKSCIADVFSLYVATGFSLSGELSMLEAWLAMLCYTIQIYFDFSGYTDMALGSAKMLNIDLPINFNSPYKSISIQEFWKRWHITLSRFLRDYIYIPLGGNRKGELRMYTNMVTTMLIGGLWHGASWLFVIWGGLHGVAQVIHKLYLKTKIEIPKWTAVVITFLFVNFTWVIFRAQNLKQVGNLYQKMFDFSSFIMPKFHHMDIKFDLNIYHSMTYMLPLALILIFVFPNSLEIIKKININSKNKAIILGLIFTVIFMFCLSKICVSEYSEFIYFNF